MNDPEAPQIQGYKAMLLIRIFDALARDCALQVLRQNNSGEFQTCWS